MFGMCNQHSTRGSNVGLGGLYGHAESVNPTEQAKLNYQSPASDMDVEKEDPEKPTKKRVTLGERMTN